MAEPIRILHCVARMNRGGAEALIMNMYRNMDRSVVQFDFVQHTNQKCAYDDEILKLGGRIFRVPRYTVHNHLAYKRAWLKLFQVHAGEWRVIHGHMFSTAAIYLEVARKFGLITIAHSHNTSSGSGLSAFVKDLLQNQLRERPPDYLFACSETAGEWLFGRNNLPRVQILNNSVDSGNFAYDEILRIRVRKELGLENRLTVGHVGRFEEQKNHIFLVEVFREILKLRPDALLLLIGQGGLEKSVQDKVRQMGIQDRVRFMGVRSDVADLMQAMDVFLFPSLFEGLPVTIIEAQAAGLPCVLSDTITAEVKITDLVSFLSLQQSVAQWARQVVEQATKTTRRNTSQEIVDANYDVKSTALWLQNFYLEIQH